MSLTYFTIMKYPTASLAQSPVGGGLT